MSQSFVCNGFFAMSHFLEGWFVRRTEKTGETSSELAATCPNKRLFLPYDPATVKRHPALSRTFPAAVSGRA
jgi:hypothetical protein